MATNTSARTAANSSQTASSSFSYAEFTPVKSRKNRKNRAPRIALPIAPPIVDGLRTQLRADEWFTQCSRVIKREWTALFPEVSSTKEARVLCLGLGSPSASPIARIQLAFLAEICNLLNIITDAIFLYDPVFSADDIALFNAMNMHVLPWDNSAPDYALGESPTLFFMPHCDMELYETLLRANWAPTSLARCFLLGNQLQEYIDNKPTSTLEEKAPCLLRAAPLFESHLLPPSNAWPTAFNNTAVQIIQAKFRVMESQVTTTVTPRTRPCEPDGDAVRQSDNNNASISANGDNSHVPSSDSEEKGEGASDMEPAGSDLEAYVAIFGDAPWRASAPAPAPDKPDVPPQAPQITAQVFGSASVGTGPTAKDAPDAGNAVF